VTIRFDRGNIDLIINCESSDTIGSIFEVTMKSAILRILRGDMEKRAFGDNNPALAAIAQYFMQAPPPNLPQIAQLYAQKLERDAKRDIERPSYFEEEMSDPLRVENKRLRAILDNIDTKISLLQRQKELARIQGEMAAAQGMAANVAAGAVGGALPMEAGGVPPEVPAQAAEPAPAQAPQAIPPANEVGPAEAAAM
jgi:hypothetical protein